MASFDFEKIQTSLLDYLVSKGIHAVAAWEEGSDCDHPVVLVSMESCQVDSAGMGDYLGELENQETGLFEEVYGLRCFLTLGLDVYAPPGGGEKPLQTAVGALLSALGESDHAVMQVREFRTGTTLYDVESGRLSKKVEMKNTLYLYYMEGSDEPFLDFDLRGEVTNARNHL